MMILSVMLHTLIQTASKNTLQRKQLQISKIMPVVNIFVSIKEFLQNNSKAKKNEQCVTPDAHQESKHIQHKT